MTLAFAPITAWHWLALGGLLVIVEAFAPGFMLVGLGAAAGLVGIGLFFWPGLPVSGQLLLFACCAIAGMFAFRRLQSMHVAGSERPALNRRAAQYIGQHAVVVEPIVNGRGRVELGDSSWPVRGRDAPKGGVVEITGADGALLLVEPVAAVARPADAAGNGGPS